LTISAQPPGTVSGRIKVTEQGEVITAKFSDRRLAAHSLQQTLAAVARATVARGPQLDPAWREEMARIGAAAADAYRGLVYDDPELLAAFRQCTPVDVLGELNIGSRPVSRGPRTTVEALRAIPWVFAWAQSRLALPAWYGAGTGLGGGDLDLQRTMYERWPFFHGLMTTLGGALATADLPIGAHYFALVEPPERRARLWTLMCAEHARCEAAVTSITHARAGGASSVAASALDRRAWRRAWLAVLSLAQVELLRRDRAGDAGAREPLLASVAGIATGLRTTG
jgi:phosphoenolpyruvate carboxylase